MNFNLFFRKNTRKQTYSSFYYKKTIPFSPFSRVNNLNYYLQSKLFYFLSLKKPLRSSSMRFRQDRKHSESLRWDFGKMLITLNQYKITLVILLNFTFISKKQPKSNKNIHMIKTLLTASFFLLGLLTTNAQYENYTTEWSPIFEQKNTTGTIILYDTSSGKSKIYNLERCDSAYIPASTFKILNSLISLETKVIKSINDTIKWNGTDYGWDKWNTDQTMKTAMPLSCIWFYQELARRIGIKDMQKWIDSVGYGNTKMGGLIDNFWLEGDIRISAREQVHFIERLIKNDLPFSIKNQETVKKIMITDSTKNYVLHSKTGWAMRIKKQIGWFVGYVETKNNTWIFALNIDIKKKEDSKRRKQITYEILKREGIIN